VQHVGWLDVAVDDPLLVGEGERARQVEADLHRLAERHSHLVEAVGQRLARQVLEHHVGTAAAVEPDVEDRHDGGVLHLGGRLRLALEPLEVGAPGPLAAAARRDQGLDGHHPVEQRVAGLVHHAHRALAEGLEDLVAADGLDLAAGHRLVQPHPGRRDEAHARHGAGPLGRRWRCRMITHGREPRVGKRRYHAGGDDSPRACRSGRL
jgi:hypothetical protein